MRFMITAAPDPNRKKDEPFTPPSDQLFAEYMKFNEELAKAGVLVVAEGLSPDGKGARVGVSKGKRVVLDGPFVESKELVGGFYLIEVDSREEAVEWMLKCPVGLGFDDVLTLHQMQDGSGIPQKYLDIIAEVAPTWNASLGKPKSKTGRKSF